MKRRSALFVALLALAGLLPATAAGASSRPVITGLSAHHGAYWGGAEITVRGSGFSGVQEVRFGSSWAAVVRVSSASSMTVRVPWHDYATVDVRVRTGAGTSRRSKADRFRFARPSMNSPIMGGLTARQEQRISAQLRARHHGVRTVRAAHGWTPAVGLTAVRRAQSWLGMPYSWAGGNGSGPTRGVCTHNGGDLDCHVVGFDCSGLTLHAWSPYRKLSHFAQTQRGQAGRFHPSLGQLAPGDLVFFSAYLPSGIGHVAIYAGNGMVIEAPESGRPVRWSRLADVIAYSGHYRGATRPLTGRARGRGPAVASVGPVVPTAGGTVVLRGANLAAATSVSIGGTLSYPFVDRSTNRVVLRVPGHRAGTVPITVFNPWGSARTSLRYVAAPHVGRIAPSTGPVSGGTATTLSGRHLAGITGATVDGQPVAVAVTSDRQVQLIMPAHPAGTVTITLHSPVGDANPMTFVYADPTTPGPSPSPSPSGQGEQ